MEQTKARDQEEMQIKMMDEAETSATNSPASPGVCLLLISPLSTDDYIQNFAEGDVDECYRRLCCNNPAAFRGSWQLLLGGRSDSVEELLGALGISLLKRKVMATYASVTDVQILDEGLNQQQKQQQQQQTEGAAEEAITTTATNACCPTIQLTTHLPLKNTKQGTFCFDGSCTELQDTDTGAWQCRCVWLSGRALQRRWSPRGVMIDARCIFAEDPLSTDKQPGPVMLFQWTFRPHGKAPIKAMRWLKKI